MKKSQFFIAFFVLIVCSSSYARDINITGTIDVKGSVNASEEVSAKGIKLSEHTHSGVKAGGDTTGGPQ